MALVCDVCGKRPQFGMRLSHSHRRTKRRWNPNVQKVRAIVNGTPKRGWSTFINQLTYLPVKVVGTTR